MAFPFVVLHEREPNSPIYRYYPLSVDTGQNRSDATSFDTSQSPPPLQTPHRSPIRRKPLPLRADPLPFSSPSPSLDQFPIPPSVRAYAPAALDRPQVPSGPASPDPVVPLPLRRTVARDVERLYHQDYSHQDVQAPFQKALAPIEIDIRAQISPSRVLSRSPTSPRHARSISDSKLNFEHTIERSAARSRRSSTSNMTTVHPNLALPQGGAYMFDPNEDGTKPKSPGRFGSIFRWGSASEQGTGSMTTGLSDRMPSPSLSPKSTPASLSTSTSKALPAAIDIPRANASRDMLSDSGISLLPSTPSSFDAIEEEVRVVSADLAASIRREMDLEDLVERLQAEAAERGSTGRRTSDYFSDAGTPVRSLDGDMKDPEAERLVRNAQQEKAQLRLDMLGKVQEEREKRRAAELQVKELEELVAKSSDSHLAAPDVPVRIGDLESALDDAKRKLAEERQMKENFEDLLSALKEELEANRNERDNLRDEVVPQLRARVEGLETEASDLQRLMYEHSRMQQELASLKSENASLAAAIREKNQNSTRQSQTGSPSGYATPATPPGMSMPLNPKDRESLAERLKDVEFQRDALHKALKSLRDRQQYESKKSRERIRALETERDLGRQGRDKEVSALRREVDRLRRRADDALEQKFVCERSLGTLKMDLEKAEQETGTLRALLQEHDDLVAEHQELKDSHGRLSREVSEFRQGSHLEFPSASLQQAYRDLQQLHERSLARLDELEKRGVDPGFVSERERRLSEVNEESQRAIQKLRKSLTEAEVQRDTALVEAEASRKRVESLQKSEGMQMQEERGLATQLRISSERVEELATQIRAQLASNENLRERLADCISRGENEQRTSAKKINDLQDKLRTLEDRVMEAQQQAEEAVAKHEDELRLIKETHTSQLRRLKSTTVKSPAFSPKSPVSPFFRSPRLEWASLQKSSAEGSKTEHLERRVSELEKALSDADDQMTQVVSIMNMAQIEVLELQSERDEALRQTRRLQTELLNQQAKYSKLA